MGKKVHPKAFRLNSIFSWDSKWFAKKKDFKKYLELDHDIKEYLKKELKHAGIAKIGVEKKTNDLIINIQSAKPGIIIGRGGSGIKTIKNKLKNEFFASEKVNLEVNVLEVPKQSLNAQLVLGNMANELERRIPFRRVMKQALNKVQRAGAQGVKISIAGRLNGAEIARTEKVAAGKIPLHTLRANIDYAAGIAHTIYGVLGLKVWIYKGDLFKRQDGMKTQSKKNKKFSKRRSERNTKNRKSYKKNRK